MLFAFKRFGKKAAETESKPHGDLISLPLNFLIFLANDSCNYIHSDDPTSNFRS